jgi:DNA adenine methylase
LEEVVVMAKRNARVEELKAPFPWFGGKRLVADLVWKHLGNVELYIEPFFGGGAVLFGRPHYKSGDRRREIINDKDAFVCNVWRSIQYDPETTARYAVNPVFENDLHARQIWLVHRREELTSRLEGDPEYFDPKIAGWWVWGICNWIGGRWCSGKHGPWVLRDGRLVNTNTDDKQEGVSRKKPSVIGSKGVMRGELSLLRQKPGILLMGNAVGVKRELSLPRQKPIADQSYALTTLGSSLEERTILVYNWFEVLKERLFDVLVLCGDWSRACTKSVISQGGKNPVVGILLDPPYSGDAGRNNDLYGVEDTTVSADVRNWCIENGDNPKLRIALCGYKGEHRMPDSWKCVAWKTTGGYNNVGGKNQNSRRERIWFSPACLMRSRASFLDNLSSDQRESLIRDRGKSNDS